MGSPATTHRTGGAHPMLLAAIRVAVAAVWIYEGLWLKLIRPAPHEIEVVKAVAVGPFTPAVIFGIVGGGETLLGLGVLSGWFSRPLAIFQGAVLILMNAIGILAGGGAIANPVGLVIHNLPLLMCIAVLGVEGPGAWVIPTLRRKT